MNKLEHINCPLCDSNNHRKLFTGKDYLFSQEKFTVARCKSCGLFFTNPRVTEDRVPYYYYSEYSPYREVKQSANFLSKIKNRLGYILGNRHCQILEILQSIKAKNALEIGPGAGSLLSFLKEHGFEVVGVEIDSKCVERIREKGIVCYLGDLKEVVGEMGSAKFDAVILHHVFEHLYHPLETLRNIHKLLNENGIVYLSIPNSASIEARLFGKYWSGFDLPRHVIHYDINSIRRILSMTNFTIAKLEKEFFPSSFVESIGFLLFKRRIPQILYSILYYPWKILGVVHTKIIGSGCMRIVATKA